MAPLLDPLAPAAGGRGATIEDLPSDMLACVLSRLDGPALASASCATAYLRGLAGDPGAWRDLCLATWPSLRHPSLLPLLAASPRAFFADAFPFPQSQPSPSPDDLDLPPGLISAVDLYHNGAPILSRVVETDCASRWFLGSPLRIYALDRKESPPAPTAKLAAISPEELTLSWIVIDPAARRAVNVSSRRPVAVDRHWYTGETLIRFATAAGGGEASVGALVAWSEEVGHVTEVSLGVEDADGVAVGGRGGLAILRGLLGGGRRWRGGEEAAAVSAYGEFVGRKRWRKERKARREWAVDFCCSALGAAAFVTLLLTWVLR